MDRKQTTQDICETFDVNERTVANWVKRKCPCDKGGKGRLRMFDEGEVAAWIKDNGLVGKVGKPSGPLGDQLAAAKIRKELALAEKHELAVTERKALLILKSEAEQLNVAKFTVIRNKLLGLPSSAAPALLGKSVEEIQQLLRKRVEEVLTELSQS
jgi:phage terminase Nu1 subunit (DNA packaging protein)